MAPLYITTAYHWRGKFGNDDTVFRSSKTHALWSLPPRDNLKASHYLLIPTFLAIGSQYDAMTEIWSNDAQEANIQCCPLLEADWL